MRSDNREQQYKLLRRWIRRDERSGTKDISGYNRMKREAEKARRLQNLAAQQGMRVVQNGQSEEQPTVQAEKKGPGRAWGTSVFC